MRVVGKRQHPIPEGPHWPTPEESGWTEDAAKVAGVAPKGVFRYRSHRDANADMERWLGEAMARQALEMDRHGASPEPAALGAETARPALWSDVEMVVGLLERRRVAYVLIGGYASLANGLARQTGDVDILVTDTPENNRRWIAALGELPDGAAKELSGDDHPFAMDVAAEDAELAEGRPAAGVIRINDVITVDVMPAACGCSYDELKPHVARVSRGGRGMNVLNLDGLLKTKQGVRPKDQVDRRRLEWAISHRSGPRDGLAGSDGEGADDQARDADVPNDGFGR